jgi:hypothetical protein
MNDQKGMPTSPEELLACAARADRSKHILCLFLGIDRQEIETDLGKVLARALRRVPAGRPLRRERDRKIVRAVSLLVPDMDPADRRLKELRLRLRDAERRAGLSR